MNVRSVTNADSKKGIFHSEISKTALIDGIEVCLEENAIVSLDKFNDYFANIKPLIEQYLDKNKNLLYELENKYISKKTDETENLIYQIFDKYRCNCEYADLSSLGAKNLDVGKGLYILFESSKEILKCFDNKSKEE